MVDVTGPLLTLALRIRSTGPPSLTALIARLEEMEEYDDFAALVREFLPDREREILNLCTPTEQIAAFATHFEDRYFPLHDGMKVMVEEYRELTIGIPLILMGLSWDDYHEIPSEYRLGFQLMTFLLETPWGEDDGARVPLGEACEGHVPADLLSRVPEGGLSREEAHRLLDDTPHAALALWADILNQDTGNPFLDSTYEEWYDPPPWDRETVDHLTGEWLRSEGITQKVWAFADWLEGDPSGHFGELLDFLERRRYELEQ